MNRIILTFFALMLFSSSVFAQRYYTKSGKVSFYSKAPLENIESINKTAACILDAATGTIQCSVLIRGFEFAKALMQEHFNENYLESDKYPNAVFKGTVTNNSDIHYNTSGVYTAHIQGQLTMHGITKSLETTATINVGNQLETHSEFQVALSDYNIKIPSIVKDNISSSVKVDFSAKLDPLKAP